MVGPIKNLIRKNGFEVLLGRTDLLLDIFSIIVIK